MDGMAYDLCVICGDYVFDYEADDFGEAFFAFGTRLPSHHNQCLTARFAATGELDPGYVAENKPEAIRAARDFLQSRIAALEPHEIDAAGEGAQRGSQPHGPPDSAPADRAATYVVPVFPCRYAFPSREAVFFPNVVNLREPIQSPYERSGIRSLVKRGAADGHPEAFLAAFVPVRDPQKLDNFTTDDFHSCGVLAQVALEEYHEDSSRDLFAVIRCLHRVKISWNDSDPSPGATATPVADLLDLDISDERTIARVECLAELAERLGDGHLGSVVLDRMRNRREVIRRGELPLLLDAFAFSAGLSSLWADQLFPYRYAILESPLLSVRLDRALELAEELLRFAETTRKLNMEVEAKEREELRQQNIRAQIKALQTQLNDQDDNDTARYEHLLGELETVRQQLHPLVVQEASDQLSRLKRYKPEDATYSKLASWLDFYFALPWTRRTEDNFDLDRAKEILEQHHFGLRRVKERIVEYIALLKRQEERRRLIERGELEDRDEYRKRVVLCFVGPPGVAKTSLGKSIASALGRRFCRISLGGIEDEHEITGFEETYQGSLPGRIMRAIKQVGSRNPVLMLDELDKTKKVRGNPEAALLEMLDSTLTDGFVDKYVRAPFDLSDVLFIATANSLEGMMPALVDRMEITEFSGYTTREKLEIAKRHLIPSGLEYHNITDAVEFPNETIEAIVNGWTQEAGVRMLEQRIAKICRKMIETSASEGLRITPTMLPAYLGPRIVYDEARTLMVQPGVAMGLAYTAAGGTVMFVEAERYAADQTFVRIEDQISVTGRVASVMRESILVALKRVRKLAEDENNAFGISKATFEKTHFDVNVSPLSVEKDGPSGAVAVFAALVSVLSGVCIDQDVGLTGELNQRGMVLPVGGLVQKLAAAHRHGLKRVLYPWQLEEEVEHLKQENPDLKELTLIPVRNDREVLGYSFADHLGKRDP